MCGVFSYLLCSPKGDLNSGYLEWGFLPKFRVNLNMLCIPYVVVQRKRPLEWGFVKKIDPQNRAIMGVKNYVHA